MADSVPRRHGKSRSNRPFQVDGRDYAVTVSPDGFDADKNVRMRVTFCAQFGHRSVCIVRGLTNRSYWWDYPDFDATQAATRSITPLVVCGLIRLAHQQGWDPDASKSNFELAVDSEVIRNLTSDDVPPNSDR